MANQYVNKFVKDGVTKFDLTNDTVTADTLLSGRTAHLASGAQVTGTFEPVTGVKGNAESTYRKGNVNLTPANIGAATSAQGAKADSAVQTIQIGGTAQTKTYGVVNLPAYPTIPTVNDGTLTIQQNGTTKATFTANQVGNTTANLTDTTYSAGNTMTLNNTIFDIGKRWTAVSKGQTWSRLFLSTRIYVAIGSSGILSISATRTNTIVNATFLITSSSAGGKSCQIIELASANYSSVRCRCVTSKNGIFYFEIYDTTADVTQNWNCIYIPLIPSTLTSYTEFTDGTTIPDGWVAENDFATTVGSASAAIKNITRSGTTFTATKQDGSTFTFDQEGNQEQIDYNTNQGVKNLCKITAESQTINGVTFTVDKVAGTITANGTATAQISFKIGDYISSILQVGNKYTLSGCPAGGNYTSTYALYVFNASTGSTVWADVGLSGGSSYVIPSDIRLSPLHILIRSGVTCNNLVFKPMIRDASIKDNTFEPYAMSNAELTQKVEDISDCLYIEAYNAGTAVTIQNTSDFTLNLFNKFSTIDAKPKFAFLKLSSSGMTYYLRAMINVMLASPGATIDVSFIADGTTLYNFGWYMQSGTVSTPTITAKTLSFA